MWWSVSNVSLCHITNAAVCKSGRIVTTKTDDDQLKQELQEIFKTDLKDVKVTTNYDTVKEKCDIFFMYADDYIWEFKTQEIL